MIETTCPLCNKKISIDDETVYKQHVLCPYCGGKFSYLAEDAEFSTERLSYAIAECRKDNADNRYYNLAPAGARLYIGLIFYGKVFKGEMDKDLYLAAMGEIESQLKKRDWQYLFDNESDPELVAHFKDRLDFAKAGPETTRTFRPADNQQRQKDTMVADQRMAVAERIKEAAAQRETRAWKQQLASRLVTTACFLAVIIVGYMLISKALPVGTGHVEAPVTDVMEPQKPTAQNNVPLTTAPANPPAKKHCPAPVQIATSHSTDVKPDHAIQTTSKTPPPPTVEDHPVDDCWDKALLAFADIGILFWEELKLKERPCGNPGTWYCAIPKAEAGFDMYKIECLTSSNTVWMLARGKEPQKTTQQEFDKSMRARGAIFANGEVAVLRGFGHMDPVVLAIPKKDETTSVGKTYFEKAYPCLRELKVNISSVLFRIELKRSAKVLTVKDVRVDEEVGREPFADAARNVLTEGKRNHISANDAHVKKPKTTVIEYDGKIIKNGINGVTYVPKRFPYEDVLEEDMRCSGWWHDRRRCRCEGCKLRQKVASMRRLWTPLHEQAIEQAAAMEEYKIKVQQEIERLRQNVKVAPWEVNGFLSGAKATFRRLQNAPSEHKEDEMD